MLRDLVDELGELHRQVGHLRSRLDRARRTEKEERERLQAELEQAKSLCGHCPERRPDAAVHARLRRLGGRRDARPRPRVPG